MHTATGSLSITVSAVLTITTAAGTLPTTGEAGAAYAATSLTQSGGVGPFNWVINSGSLPNGLSLSTAGSISGTISPTAVPGTFSFTAKVTDSQGNVVISGTISIKVDAALAITPPTFPTGVINVSYPAETFTATGGSGSGYTFALATGTLPSPLTVGASGTIASAVLTASGTFTFTLKVTDSLGYTVPTGSLSITINPAITVALSPASPVTLDQGGTQLITAITTNDPNTAGVTWAIASGLGSLTGQSSATTVTFNAPANVAVASTAVVSATSKTDPSKSAAFTINLILPPQITTTTMTPGTVNVLYSSPVNVTGGVAPYTWAIVTAPAGLTLNSSTSNAVVVGGTPTVPGANQTFTIKVTDAQGVSATSSGLTITIFPTLTIAAPALPVGVVGASYTAPAFTASGGSGTGYVFLVASGSILPLVLNQSTGIISGTPSSTVPIQFTVKVTDSVGNVATTGNLTININAAPAITSAGSTTFSVGVAGLFTVTTTGLPKPALSDGGATLPSGVTFTDNGNGTATLAGTPATGTAGPYAFTITASNGIGTNATQSFTLTVNTAPGFTSANTATFTVGALGSFTLTTTGIPTATVSQTGGTLPNGVTFTPNGGGTATLAGTPAAGTGGSYSITFTASNGVGTPATQSFTLKINQAPLITSLNSASFSEGALSSFTVMTTGFPAPSLSDGGATLPTGVSFQDNGNGTATIAGTPAAGTAATSPYPFTITASNTTNPNATQSFTLTVNTTPAFTSATSTIFTVGTLGSFTATATGSPTYTETGALPTGVTFTAGTATLSGTPAVGTGGTYSITIKATNGSGTTSQSFTLTVNSAPSFTSLASATFTVGSSGLFTVTTSAFPKAALNDGGATLPTGVSFQDNGDGTATLSGTPAIGTANTYPFTITASNGIGTNATQSFTLTVTATLTSFSISGSLTYGGSMTGRTYIRVSPSGCNGCNAVAGTSISTAPSSTGTAYTVRGLQPVGSGGNGNGSYVVTVEIDTLGNGAPNASNPVGNSSAVTVTSSNVTGVNITVNNQTPPAPVTPSGLTISPGGAFALASYNGNNLQDNNGREIATSYKFYIAQDVNFTVGLTTVTFAAKGNNDNTFILRGLTNGLTYYFKTSMLVGTTESALSAVVGPITIGSLTGPNTVSGTVTIPGTITGPLYVGLYNNNTNQIYAQVITSPTASQAYSVSAPSGSYTNFAIVDNNNNGLFGSGNLSNVNGNGPSAPLTVSGNITNANITLSNAAATASVTTSHQKFSPSIGGPDTYSLSLGINWGIKRPVAVTLTTAPNVAVPWDIPVDNNTVRTPNFINGAIPALGDAYSFQVTYSDLSTATVTGTLTAVLNSFAQNLAMNSPIAGSLTIPELNWSAPASPPTPFYSYSVGLYSTSNTTSENWNYSGPQHNNGAGIPSTTTSLAFDLDGSANPNSSLTTGITYNWWVTVQDANGDSAQFTTPYAP
jgi:large repetitive protein